MLRGLEGGIVSLRLLLLYRLQWVKLRLHQHYPVNMHRVIQCDYPDRECAVVKERKKVCTEQI